MKKPALSMLTLFCLLPFVVATAQDGGDASGDAYCANYPCLTTYHNSNARTGVNVHEQTLVANSTGWTATFGATQAQVPTDGMIYAQPLYVSKVAWTGGTGTNCPSATLKNMVYVATEGNTIYAIDADNYGVCASASLNTANTGGITDVPIPVLNGPVCNNLTHSTTYGTVGVTGTPVIDPNNNMLFVVSAHMVTNNNVTTYTQRLNAVNITNLSLVASSVDIPNALSGKTPTFDARNERAAANQAGK